MPFELTINGERVRVEDAAPTTTLLDFLRSTGRTGTKLGCAEGDCGACSVALVDRDAAGRATYRSIASCIAFLPMFADREIVTVEGLAGAAGSDGARALHPVQSAMVAHYGSQCGFCTPGFIVSLFEGYYRPGCRDAGAIHAQLCGNLCRCTGYRPIRDAAAAALAGRSPESLRDDPFARRLDRPVDPPPSLGYEAAGQTFHRPGTLPELFGLLARLPSAQLVAGATELGVDLNKKQRSLPALISLESVPELTAIRAEREAWHVGAAANLTSVEEALAGEFPSLARMFSVFASRQIRSRATLGGNLATASPIGDSAPVLITLGARVVLASAQGEREMAVEEFFAGYRKTQLRPGEVLKEIVVPRWHSDGGLVRRADFIKASHRRELDISIAAGAFCVDEEPDGTVRRARIAYGGLAPTTVRVRAAEQALEGRRLREAAGEVSRILAGAFEPIDDVRAGAAYRRGLAVSLWERFADGVASEIPGASPAFSPRPIWPADPAGRSLKHESGVGHVTGAARYVDDLGRCRPMLELWPVCSPHAHARIARRDASRARSAPGVAAVLLAEDIPGVNNTGTVRHDEPLLASDEVAYHGQLVAVVVGESLDACRRAAALVEVEYEPLPAILGVPAAIAQGSYHTSPHVLARGDSSAALARAPHRLAGEFSVGGQEHFYLETQAAWAELGEDRDVVVCSSTQHPTEIQHIVAEVLGRPLHRVVVQAPRMGGGFGGKESQANATAALAALAAVKTGRPVRVQWDRDVDMTVTGKRHPFFARFDVGFDGEGMILAADVELVSDGGWSLDLSQAVLDRALFHLDNGYYLPAVRFTGRVARTHVTSHTAFRGFGGPQGMLVMEEILDRVARTVGLPPETVRERNLYRGSGATNTTHFGQEIGDNRLRKMWEAALAESGFSKRRAALAAWNRSHGRMRRGLAITPVKFGIAFTQTAFNKAGAYVMLYADGTAQVNHGGTEMGQGLHTKILGVAVRELGLPADAIRVMPTSTDKIPNTSPTAGSSGSDLNGAAVRDACLVLRGRLLPVAARLLAEIRGVPVREEEVVFREGRAATQDQTAAVALSTVCRRAIAERVSLAATGFYRTPGLSWDWATATGRPFNYFAGGVAVSEVEVDGYTGMSRLLRVDIVHDIGDSLNPGIDRGQIEGAFVQGMGWLTSEELKWDGKGRLLTHSASTYQIPAISDAPPEFNVMLLPDAAQANTIHGSKAVGEPPLMLAISVREAIRDAVASFGTEGGQVPLPSPATGEAVFHAIQERLNPEIS